MSLDEIANVVLLFSNPVWTGANTIPSTIIRNISAWSSQMSYSAQITENITTLIDRYAETDNGVIRGLLYVPDLNPGDPCRLIEKDYVPKTATRQANLPPTNYNLIALAPWISVNCTKGYLAGARLDPLRALIFYFPQNSTEKPPDVDSPVWDLDDDGLWKTQNHFPIYAVPGIVGESMMYELSLYSGNISDVPYGSNITSYYNADPQDYVRIWTELTVSTNSTLPSLWVFVLIVIGLLLVVITLTSFFMHVVQARRRASLRRRVVAGEVNLEAMGIKRLTVPLDHLQTFPLFTYHYEPETTSPPVSPTSPRSPRRSRLQRSSREVSDDVVGSTQTTRTPGISENALASSVAGTTFPAIDYQPTCAICLEAYQNRSTVIRELPCGHIFHPECIDEFLSQISSLCPLCRVCMLPKGYSPRITNGMVRRERAIRRLRDRIVIDDSDAESTHGRIHGWGSTLKKRLFSLSSSTSPNPSIELEAQPRQPQQPSQQPALPQHQRVRSEQRVRRASGRGSPTVLARQRMRDLAGSEIDDGEARASRWKRIKHKVFPGFH